MTSDYLTLNYDSEYKEILPGVLVFEDAFSTSKEMMEDINTIYYKYSELDEKLKEYMKNSIFFILEKNQKQDIIIQLQKIALNCLAKYCDHYPEAIHSLQWQESYKLIIEEPGHEKEIFNPSKSSLDAEKNIISSPFSRQIVVELCIEDTTLFPEYNFIYFNNEINYSIFPGNIIIYPANFLWSREQSSIMNGRRIILRTFFNGGKDFASEKDIYDSVDNLFYSYMR